MLRSIAIIILLLAAPLGQANELIFSGYVKSYAVAQDEISVANSAEKIDANYQSQNALRLMANYFLSDENGADNSAGNFEVHYEVQPLYFSDNNPFSNSQAIDNNLFNTLTVGANQYRFKDIPTVLTDSGEHFTTIQNLDRLNYRYSSNTGDLTVGRQVISFGSARFINPTDIFVPFALQTLNQEYRVGIDAIRFQAELGDFAQLDSGLIIGEDAKKQNSALFLRAKNSIAGNDIEAMLIALDQSALIGGGLERAIGNFGFWFEAAYMAYASSKKDASAGQNNSNYWRSSIGSDYAIIDDVIVMLEYHYNGAGSDNSDNYLHNINKEAYQKAGVYLLGEHYFIPSLIWVASPLVTLNAAGFFNLSDHSLFFNLAAEVSWSDNLYSDFGAYLTHGDGLTLESNPPTLQVGSEFGTYPATAFASLRYYF